MSINKDIQEFSNEGFVVLKYNNIQYLKKFREIVLKNLREILDNDNVTLENFHTFINDDKQKIDIHYKLSSIIWDEQLHIKIIEDNIDLYRNIIGNDLDIQAKPHLRIVRPHCPQDNIGFHRDSFYGNTPSEISSFIPLVDLDEKSAFMIEPKSHQRPIVYQKTESKNIVKEGRQHQLGFPYAPKIIDKDYSIDKLAIPMTFGNVLIFGSDTTHGQDVNYSNITRWSVDMKVRNSLLSSNTKDGYYKTLSKSILSKYAEKCYDNSI